jgi:hypothetical protein
LVCAPDPGNERNVSRAAASAARRVDCGEIDPGAVIRPIPREWHPHMPEQLDDEELAD